MAILKELAARVDEGRSARPRNITSFKIKNAKVYKDPPR